MTAEEIISRVNSERLKKGRFPTRIIYIHTFFDYNAIIKELSASCDEVLNLADFTDDDILPNISSFYDEARKHENKQILFLSFGEYLRICGRREKSKALGHFPGLWECMQSVDSTTKFIIPLFCDREIFEILTSNIDERMKDFIWCLNRGLDDRRYNIEIYSQDFIGSITPDAGSLKEWLSRWETLFSNTIGGNLKLLTKLYRHAEPTSGLININIYDSPFKYVVSQVSDGDKLKDSYASPKFWSTMIQHLKANQPFSETIKSVLSISQFDPITILVRFDNLNEDQLNAFFIWYKIYESNDYYTWAISKAKKVSDIRRYIRDAVFDLAEIKDEFAEQRRSALRLLKVSYNEGYFEKIQKVPKAEDRFKLLTCQTIEECACAIKMVSELLRSECDIKNILNIIKKIYPDLYEYLEPDCYACDEIMDYFEWYRKCKIINRVNINMPNSIDYNAIDSRNKVIQQSETNGYKAFWVDGLGVEWMPLLLSRAKALEMEVDIVPNVAKALLPTETTHNHKWNARDIKWDKLDKLSHEGIVDNKNDYFLCIAKQFETIREIVDEVERMLLVQNKVLITGDHGSSRLAALAFHDRENRPITPPPNATVHSFGRYIEIKDDARFLLSRSMEDVELDGRHYIVMKTYEHFTQSGNAAGGNSDDNPVAGEIHGGMTPEEYLVPVIVISRKVPLPAAVVSETSKRRGFTYTLSGEP
ncbi:MAG: BREX-4 system phosphatase PglZ [Christensenellaceae bacterium]|jgi:hypothetical protein|nr:BREX-4 system phosphatase PglZ [Christensenellaceae bacterium]